MPQNLPGFGALHDNLSQNGTIGWNRVLSPTLVNMANITISRLSMHRTSENSFSNDIVSELESPEWFRRQRRIWCAVVHVQGYSGMGDSFIATPMHALGHDCRGA